MFTITIQPQIIWTQPQRRADDMPVDQVIMN